MQGTRAEAWDILQYLFKVKKINNHVLHFAAEFSSRLDIGRLKQAVALLTDAFPLIRCGYDVSGSRPVWAEKDRAADRLVTLAEAEDPYEGARRFLCRELDLANGPQMEIGIFQGGESDILCVLINHMLCDAAGFKQVLYTLAALYTGLENGNPPSLPAGSLMRDRTVGQLLKKTSLRDRIGILCSKGSLNPQGNQQFNFEGDLSQPFIEVRTVPREQFCTLKAYAKKRGASVNDLMMAVYLRVLHRIFGSTAPLPCAIDLRRFLPDRKADGICNMMSNLNCDIGPDIGESLESTLLKVKKQMDAQKANPGCMKNIVLLEMLFNVLPCRTATGLMKKYFSNPPVAFTNIGVLDQKRLVFGNAEMTRAFMTGSIKYSPFFQVSLTTFRDEAVLCVNLYGTKADRRKIADFLDDFTAELQSAV